MKTKTQVHADDGRPDLLITRDFDLPVERLFLAYEMPQLVAQWMGTEVIKLENRRHGSWQFETRNAEGATVFAAHGCIHEFTRPERIVRTFEMTSAGFPPQLEFLEFEAISDSSSRLRMQIVFRSVQARDRQLQLPFAYGLNMAHDRLESVLSELA